MDKGKTIEIVGDARLYIQGVTNMAPAQIGLDRVLTRAEAEALTEDVIADLQIVDHRLDQVREKVMALYAGHCWENLGYDSWTTYVQARFTGKHVSTIFRNLKVAMVEEIMQVPIGTYPEYTMRQLADELPELDSKKEPSEDLKDSIRAAINGALGPGDSGTPTSKQVTESMDKVNAGHPGAFPKRAKKKTMVIPGSAPSRPPKDGEVRGTKNMESNIRLLNDWVLNVRESGGIAGYTQGWTDKKRTYFRENLRHYIETFYYWVTELEGESS
jgi:hypothetical protein